MKDKDGQIIESRDGSYDARRKMFEFRNNVNMFTDSVFIRTTRLNYESEASRAVFPVEIDFWKDDNMLSAESGWYERGDETFFFTGSVHAQSPVQEGWCDSLYFYRRPNNLLMLGRVQVQDTTKNVAAVGRRMFYEDSLSQVTLTRDASVVLFTEEKGKGADSLEVRRDTLYAGAELIAYRTMKMCDIDEGVISAAESRLKDMDSDPVMEYRRKAAQAAAEAAKKAAEENAANNPELAKKNAALAKSRGKQQGKAEPPGQGAPVAPVPDEEAAPPGEKAAGKGNLPDKDTLSLKDTLAQKDTLMQRDSLAAAADSLAMLPPPDTTKVGFAWAVGKVKLYRRDIQVACDSLRYNDLDSIARFYVNPIVWNDGRRQYSADSMSVLVREKRADRASLMGNAFIITQENDKLFDQIKATEVMAWFDSTSALRRFDALGGASAIFFLKEKEEYSLVNKIDSKMISAYMSGGELQRNLIFEQSKNNAHPLPQLKEEDRKLKGFNWQPELQPRGKEDITDLEVRPSERKSYDSRPRSVFDQTDIYFPGYMKSVYSEIAAARNKPKHKPSSKDASAEVKDSLAARDSLLSLPDSLKLSVRDSLSLADSLKLSSRKDSLAVRDSLAAATDSLSAVPGKQISEKERRRLERIAAREARWARADSIDAARAAAKLEKKKAKEAEKAARLARKKAEDDYQDALRLEQYVKRYRRKYDEQQAKLAGKKQKETPKDTEEDGTDSGQIPSLREGGHPEQRGVGEPTLDIQAVEPSETPVQGAE